MTNSYTMLAALEKVLPDLTSRKTLTLHVLGAGKEEVAPLEPYEGILHELPSLEQLNIFFIGPDATDSAAKARLPPYPVCQNCRKAGKKLNLSYWSGLYHDFVTTPLYTKPDLAAAQQSGFPFGMEKEMSMKNSDGWTPTIKHLLEASHPTVFTSMNKDEMVTETAVLRKLRAHFLQRGEVNKWHSMAPINEGWYRPGVFYRNYYWYIIGPKHT
jgi:splicing suppressor protein 51